MRCAISLLLCLVGLTLFGFTATTAPGVETTEEAPLDLTGEAVGTEDTTPSNPGDDLENVADDSQPAEDLLGDEFDEQGDAIGLEDGRVNFALQGANVRDFCNWFAERLGINIVLSPKVDGPMNITLHDVPWEIALRKALETHGYVLTMDENGIYTVLTKEEVSLEPLKTEIYTLSYASAQKAAEIITPLLTKDRGIVQYDTDSNQLIVSDVPAKHADIARVLHKLDRQIAQVSIEVKLLEKSSTNGSDLGFKWSSLQSYELSATDIARGYTHTKTRTDRDLIYTNEAWSQHLEPTRGLETRTIAGTRVGGDPDLAIPLEEVVKTTTKTLILSASDFTVLFSALLREDNTELISCPKVATVDNRTAEIKVTRNLPIPNYTYNEETGSYEISAFDYEEVGIKLLITPQVNEDNYITLDVQPELSSQYDDQVFIISGSEVTIPIIDKRVASTRVIVKSSETLVIGGLTTTDETESIARVPLLSNIPIVGNLFKHKSTTKIKTDLLIFITPTLVSGGATDGAGPVTDERVGTSVAASQGTPGDENAGTEVPAHPAPTTH